MGSLVKHRTQETGERCKQRRWLAGVTTEVRIQSERKAVT